MIIRDVKQPNGTPTWAALDPPDMEAARVFYEGLFGWEFGGIARSGDDFLVARKSGRAVAGFSFRRDRTSKSPMWTTYLAAKDIDKTAARINAYGGRILLPPTREEDSAQARTATVRDAGGAIFGLWQPTHLSGISIWGECGAVIWSEQFSSDPEQCKAFYKNVFNNIRFSKPVAWHFGAPDKAIPGYTMFSVNGEDVGEYGLNAVASLGQLDPEDPLKFPHWMTCFAILDINATIETLVALGGTVLLPPYETMFGLLAIVTDNQGAPFMLAVGPRRN